MDGGGKEKEGGRGEREKKRREERRTSRLEFKEAPVESSKEKFRAPGLSDGQKCILSFSLSSIFSCKVTELPFLVVFLGENL